MKRYFLLLAIIIALLAPFSYNRSGTQPTVFAQGSPSVSGDEVCGSYTKDAQGNIIINKCTLDTGKSVVRNLVINIILPIGSALLVCFIVFRLLMAQKALMEGNVGAYKEAGEKIANAILGFFIVAGVVGGLLFAMLNFLGVKTQFTSILSMFSDAFIPHAYAQGAQMLTNPLGSNNLYDFILLFVRLFIRWFVYPAIIVIWVWTGFAFVAAQGVPEALVKARRWLLWALISTCLIFVTEGFLFALRGTINQVIPNAATQTTNNTPIYQPVPGTPGAACVINGVNGMTGTDGVCAPSAGSVGATPAANACKNKPAGTTCTVVTASGNSTGICGMNAENVYACYRASIGDSCLMPNGSAGQIGTNYQCGQLPARPLIGTGGSCRISAECASKSCVSSVCR